MNKFFNLHTVYKYDMPRSRSHNSGIILYPPYIWCIQ